MLKYDYINHRRVLARFLQIASNTNTINYTSRINNYTVWF